MILVRATLVSLVLFAHGLPGMIELNPDPHLQRELDPKDQLLLLDPSTSSVSYGASVSGTSTPTAISSISWLRKLDHRDRETPSRTYTAQEPCVLTFQSLRPLSHGPCRKFQPETPIDVSRAAQIRMIEASFSALESSDLAALKHPNKPHLTAMDSHDLLPDADIWANAYDLFRFSERPGDRPRPPEVCFYLFVRVQSSI